MGITKIQETRDKQNSNYKARMSNKAQRLELQRLIMKRFEKRIWIPDRVGNDKGSSFENWGLGICFGFSASDFS